MESIGIIPFLLFFLWLVFLLQKRNQKKRELLYQRREAFLEDIVEGVSLNPKDYIFDVRGKERSNPIERKFRRRYLFDLLELFDHRCANCKREGIKFTLDHFFIPKSQGGNLMMRHRRGYWVCNALNLCRNCNQKKRDLPAQEFFEPEDLEVLREKIGELSWSINGFPQADE